MIFKIIGFLIIIYSFFNFKKAFSFFLAFKIILVSNIALISIPGLPLLSLDMFMTMFFGVFFVTKGETFYQAKCALPFKKPFIMLIIIWLTSSIFSVAGIVSELSNLLGQIMQSVLLIWMIWEMYETGEDFRRLFQCFTYVFLVTCIYGLIEFIIQQNPIVAYEQTLVSADKVVDFTYSVGARGYRVQSFFQHCIGAGINWAMYLVFVLSLYIEGKEKILKNNKVAFGVALLCFPCIVLTKMRSALVFFMIALLSIINPQKKRIYGLAIFSIILIAIAWPMLEDSSNIFLSLFSKTAQSSIGGSTLEQRLGQFRVACDVVKSAPVFGLGYKFMSVPEYYRQSLLGLESIWLSVLTRYGIVGTVVYIYYMYYMIVKVPLYYKSRKIFFISLAYWVVYTASSLPGMLEYFLFIIIFYYIKNSEKYVNNVKKQKGKRIRISYGRKP